MKYDDKHLTGKVAWVTGSSRGIGRVIADHLASVGAKVAVHGTGPYSTRAFGEAESLAAVAEAIAEAHGVQTVAVHGDLSDAAAVADLAGQVERALGPIDILVNCAGGDVGAKGTSAPQAGKPEGNDAIHISLADIKAVLDRNLLTCIYCCRQVVPGMIERQSGWVVNIGSIAGLQGIEGSAIYATAKAAVHEYTRCLAVVGRPHDVHVNAIAPGDTYTARFANSRPIEEERMAKDGDLSRYGWPIEVAQAVEYLASEASSYVTGQVLRVDGGKQMWPA